MSGTENKFLPPRIGRYEILEELGRGGMGLVYKARDPNLDREVALKVVKLAFEADSDLQQEMHMRFEREARAAANLHSPHIVTVYDYGEDKERGERYIAMELVEGTALDELLSPGELLPLRQVNSIVRQVAEGLAYAHEKGVIHRDIKPANILITREGVAKIADFGIARVGDSTLTQQNVSLGSPSYMSPEQVTGQTVDQRSDIFSLGVVLYQLLTGERPFPGENPTVISYRIMRVEPPEPSAVNPLLPPGYDHVIRKALAKRPEDRYASAREMAEDLARLAEGEKLPESTAETRLLPSAGEKMGRVWGEIKALSGRPWARWVTAAVLVLLLVTGVVWAAVHFSSPYREVENLLKTNQHGKVIAELGEILKHSPKDHRAYYLLGREYAAVNDWKSSLQAYETALHLRPEYKTDPALQNDLVNALGRQEVADLALSIIISRKLSPLQDKLRARLSEKDYLRHWNAAKALKELGETVDELNLFKMDLLYNDNCQIRKAAAEKLGAQGGPEFLPDLEVAQYDKRNSNRECPGMLRLLEDARDKIREREAAKNKEKSNATPP